MNSLLRKVAILIRDTLSYDENLIKFGRNDSEIDDFTIDYIAVDSIGQSERLTTGEKYDGEAEVMTHYQQWMAPIVLSFYGDSAWDNANNLSLLVKSQLARELQKKLGISVYQVGGLTDVKLLTGQSYGERVELTINVQYTISVNVDILRIETAQINLTSEKGQELTP